MFLRDIHNTRYSRHSSQTTHGTSPTLLSIECMPTDTCSLLTWYPRCRSITRPPHVSIGLRLANRQGGSGGLGSRWGYLAPGLSPLSSHPSFKQTPQLHQITLHYSPSAEIKMIHNPPPLLTLDSRVGVRRMRLPDGIFSFKGQIHCKKRQFKASCNPIYLNSTRRLYSRHVTLAHNSNASSTHVLA